MMDVERALELVHNARAIAAERGINATVAVHDDAGHPLVVVRGKRWHGPYMAMGKARLAAAFAKPTKDLVAMWADRPMFPASLVEIIPGGVTVNPGRRPRCSLMACASAPSASAGATRRSTMRSPPRRLISSTGPKDRTEPTSDEPVSQSQRRKPMKENLWTRAEGAAGGPHGSRSSRRWMWRR